MVNKRLVDYINRGLEKGFGVEQLSERLIEAGWNENDVKEAADYLSGGEASEKSESLGIFSKAGKSIAHPVELFERVNSEKGFWPVLKYQLTLLIVPLIFALILYGLAASFLTFLLAGLSSEAGAIVPYIIGGSFVIFFITLAVGLFLAVPLISFLVIGIEHIFIKIFGGRGDYLQSYKSFIYSSTPSLLFGWVPVFNFAVSIWSLVLSVVAVSSLHKISKSRAALAIVTPIIILIVLMIAFLIVSVIFSA